MLQFVTVRHSASQCDEKREEKREFNCKKGAMMPQFQVRISNSVEFRLVSVRTVHIRDTHAEPTDLPPY